MEIYNISVEELAAKGPRTEGLLFRQVPFLSNDLFKKFVKFKKWQEEYCLLYKNHLYFYKNEYSKKPLHIIRLEEYQTVNQIKSGKNKNKFELVHCKSSEFPSIYFATESPTELRSWIISIKEEVNKYKGQRDNECKIDRPSNTLKSNFYNNLIYNPNQFKMALNSSLNCLNDDEDNKPKQIRRYCRYSKKQLPRAPSIVHVLIKSKIIYENYEPPVNNTYENVNIQELHNNNNKDNEIGQSCIYDDTIHFNYKKAEAELFYNSIWWENKEDPLELLEKLNIDGTFYVRKTSANNAAYVLGVYSKSFSTPKLCKHFIFVRNEEDEEAFALDNGMLHVSVEALCLYHTIHPLPSYDRKSAIVSNIEIYLKVPIKMLQNN